MLNFPVYVISIFYYSQGITGAFWPYQYYEAKNYVVQDPIVCQLAAKDVQGQRGFCSVANSYDDLIRYCSITACNEKYPTTLNIGEYGPVFWKPKLDFTHKVVGRGRNPNP